MEREAVDSTIERDLEKLKNTFNIHPPNYIPVASIEYPKSELCEKVLRYAKDELDTSIFNHSNRAFLMGYVLHKDQFPEWKIDMEAYFLTCMLHDIGLAPRHHLTTSMSFEFYGGIVAHNLITQEGKKDIADDVAEAVIRHAMNDNSYISPLGKLVQFATSLDVSGGNPQLYHPQTVQEIIEKFPSNGFHHHFADLMEKELQNKPGCHTTTHGQNYTKRVRNVDFAKLYK